MNDAIAPKWSSFKPVLIEATMFLKLSMSLIPNNLADVVESPIWNTLISFSLELLDDIDDSNDNETEQDDDEEEQDYMLIMTMMKKVMIYYQCQLKLRKLAKCANFKPFNFLVQ